MRRALDAPSRVLRYWPPVVRDMPDMEGYEVLALNNGTGKEPTIYARRKLSVKSIMRGRRATLPWRRITP
jgi:hypothetical protein